MKRRGVITILGLIVALAFGYWFKTRSRQEEKEPEPGLLYENLQYQWSAILPGGWRTSELGTAGKVVAFIAPESPDKLDSREEILKSGGMILESMTGLMATAPSLIAYRNRWEEYLQEAGAEFTVESRKIGRYDSYIFKTTNLGSENEVHVYIDTTPKMLIQMMRWEKTIEDIISRLEGGDKLFQQKKDKLDEINLFLDLINKKKYDEAYGKIARGQDLVSLEEFKAIVAGKEAWFGGATVWYSISTQGDQELYRGYVSDPVDGRRHLVFVRVNVEGGRRMVGEFSITPGLAKYDEVFDSNGEK